MKNIPIIVLALSTVLSCKHVPDRSGSTLATQDDLNSLRGSFSDALFIQSDSALEDSRCRNPWLNLIALSAADSLLRTEATTGLGAENPAGKKMKETGGYTKALRMLGVFDYEYGVGIQNANTTPCLPKKLAVHLGTFDKSYVEKNPAIFQGQNENLKAAAKLLKDNINDLKVASVNYAIDQSPYPSAGRLPKDFQAALQKGTRDRMLTIRDGIQSNSALKLEAISSAFSPLYLSMETILNRANSTAYVEAYLPPPYESRSFDSTRPLEAQFRPGIGKMDFPKTIDVSVGRLTDISYLQDYDAKDLPLIKMQVSKNFADPNSLSARMFFGKLVSEGPEKGALNMDYRDARTALVIGMFPSLTLKDDDASIVRSAKEKFNETLRAFRIEVRVHRLGLKLGRKTPDASSSAKDLELRPKFVVAESDLSFRLYHPVMAASDIAILQALKFTCTDFGESRKSCYKDFGVFTELRDFFVNRESYQPKAESLRTIIGQKFRDVMNQIVGIGVGKVINWNIGSIEAAVDAQLPAIFDNILLRQAVLSDAVKGSLEIKKAVN